MKQKAILIITILLSAMVGIGGYRYWQKSKSKSEEPKRAVQRKTVILTPAKEVLFEDILTVSGNFETKYRAIVAARTPGTLEAILVDEGQPVEKDKTMLFRTDSVKLRKAVEIAEQQLSVAKAGVQEREANLERVEADFNKAKLDYERYKRLFEQDKAVTKSAFEVQESRYLQLIASVKHAKTLVTLAKEQQKQAGGQLAISQKDLADALVLAPINGVVTKRLFEPGEHAKPGEPVIHIEDTSILEVSAFLPESYYAAVVVGKTKLRVRAGSISLGEQPVSYKSATVSSDLRTFEVKCEFRKVPAGVTAGRIAQIDVVLRAKKGIGVVTDSIVERAGKPVIFQVEGDKARQINVTTGLVSNGLTELFTASLKPGANVVSTGQYYINDGDLIVAQEQEGD